MAAEVDTPCRPHYNADAHRVLYAVRLRSAVTEQEHAHAEYPDGFLLYLNAVGIRVTMRMMERAPFYTAWREKKLHGLFITAAGASGNAATRVEAFIYSKGAYAYGGYPDIDGLFQQQAAERHRATREDVLQRIQQLTVERVMFAPIMDFRALHGVGPRVAEHTINAIPMHPIPSYEDMRLKEK